MFYLEDSLVVDSRGELESPVAPVAEGPGAADGEPCGGGGAEHLRDLGPFRRLRGHVHHPVGVEAVEEEGGTVEDELRAAPPDKRAVAPADAEAAARNGDDGQEREGGRKAAAGLGHLAAEEQRG